MEQKQAALVLIDKSGNKVRCEVVRIGRDIGADGSLELTLHTLKWLDFGSYQAVFTTSRETIEGDYEVWGSTLEPNRQVTVMGHFCRKQRSASRHSQ
jgi:hypothetical protein